jgi:hypothetical protein
LNRSDILLGIATATRKLNPTAPRIAVNNAQSSMALNSCAIQPGGLLY